MTRHSTIRTLRPPTLRLLSILTGSLTRGTRPFVAGLLIAGLSGSAPAQAQPPAAQPPAAQPEAAQPEGAQPKEGEQPEAAAPATVEVETVLSGLRNPTGLAIQPETGHVFVADSGAGRVIRVVDGQAQDVVVGFATETYGKGPSFRIGPLGLLFLDARTLVVGGGGQADGAEMLRVYTVPAVGDEPLAAESMLKHWTLPADEEAKQPGEGNFYGLAFTQGNLFVTCNGDDAKGWIARLPYRAGKMGDLARWVASKEKTGVDAPAAATVGPTGLLVVGQMGEVSAEPDSQLTYYDPENGELRAAFKTPLRDITALAFSPKGQLYAADFSWAERGQGGLFRLMARSDEPTRAAATRLAPLDGPTAMVFDPQGGLYVTVFGAPVDGDEAPPAGKLLRIAPGL